MKNGSKNTSLEQLICFNVYSLNRAFSRFYHAVFGNTGMTYPKFIVLAALEEEGPLSVSKLSTYTSMEPSTLSPLLKRMAEYGVLTRVRSTKDERRVQVELTDMGRQAVTLVREAMLEALEALGLDPSQTSEMTEMLSAACARVEGAYPPRRLELGEMPPPLPDC